MTTGLQLTFHSEAETTAFAQALAQQLAPGDTLLLSGPVGAGKTHLARQLIASILLVPEDIPSPTFTLVQTYETRLGPVWHSDLYRLGSPYEIEELGLLESFETAICLVEWPDRLGPLAPKNALHLAVSPGEAHNQRVFKAEWSDPRWLKKLQNWGKQ